MESKPIIFGVRHRDENLPAIKTAINKLANEGKKSIGIEWGYFDYQKTIANFLKKPNANPLFAEDLRLLKKHIGQLGEFFKRIRDYANNKGLKVYLLEGSAGAEAVPRISIETLNRLWTSKWSKNFWGGRKPGEDIPTAFEHFMNMMSNQAKVFPSSYVREVLRTKQMVRRIRKYRPDAVIVGGYHAAPIAMQLDIPLQAIQVIGMPHTIFGKSLKSEKWNLRLRKISKIGKRILRRKRIKRLR